MLSRSLRDRLSELIRQGAGPKPSARPPVDLKPSASPPADPKLGANLPAPSADRPADSKLSARPPSDPQVAPEQVVNGITSGAEAPGLSPGTVGTGLRSASAASQLAAQQVDETS